MNKKLNNFNPKSTHYIVDRNDLTGKGELKFLTINPFRINLTGEENVLLDAEEIENKLGLYKAIEFYKYKF